ncbi:hypothetical protein PSET11_01949 [Arthrobacter ulcerisalmonis]|uniref:Uncharacterized protein n=1 Tax=Arthrobacter ulcerisalmonis TaxID=2483813 RepID=A0A3P5X9W0_9MICC|nr:hypothetical protein PSET11_01949 [Arthrobacter ulcerisalmonis]
MRYGSNSMSVRFCTEILFSLTARSTAPERTDANTLVACATSA